MRSKSLILIFLLTLTKNTSSLFEKISQVFDYKLYERDTRIEPALSICYFYSEKHNNNTDPVVQMMSDARDKYYQMVSFKKINCDLYVNKSSEVSIDQCDEYYPDQLPNLKYYFPQEKVYFPYHPKNVPKERLVKKAETYEDLELNLVAFLPNFAWEISSMESYDKFNKETAMINKTIYFGSEEEPPSYFKGLTAHFKDILEFGFVPSSAKEVQKNFGIEILPRWIVLKKEGTVGYKIRRYVGKRSFSYLKSYLQVFVENKKVQR